MTILRILRYNPEKDRASHFEEYEVQAEKGMTVLEALLYIKEEIDGTLAVRCSCRSAICGSCAVTINQRNMLACKTQIRELKGNMVTVEPLTGYSIIKDLVVDMDPFWKQFDRLMPWLITKSPPPENERLQSPKEREFLDEPARCIMCGACSSSCPVIWTDDRYLGPAAFVKVWRFIADSRDEARYERLDLVNNEFGVWRCHTIFRCVDSCPKEINPTSAIESLRRAIIRSSFRKILPAKV